MQNVRSLLVVGRTGQLARALVAVANERNLPLVAAARPELDLSDVGSIDRIADAYRPRAIINAAAYTSVDKAESEIDLAFKDQSRRCRASCANGRAAAYSLHPRVNGLCVRW